MSVHHPREHIDYKKRFQIAGKEVLGTGAIEIVSGFSCGKIHDLLDTGALRGFHVPGSKFRRCEKKKLVSFMMSNGVAVPKWTELTEAHLGGDVESNGALHARSAFELGLELLDRSITRIVIDENAIGCSSAEIVAAIRHACEERGYPVPHMEIVDAVLPT